VLPLYRNPGIGDKVFVEARLSDGKRRLFLIDTGSALTVLSLETALALDLILEPQPGELVGLGGRTTWTGTTLPLLRLGPFSIHDIRVAVGVTGVPTHVGLVPLGGIIGNDVLGKFETTIDYPANQIELGRPGTGTVPPHAVALFFNGEHGLVQSILTARDESGFTVVQPALLEVDTGARGILLIGGTTTNLSQVSSEGVEPLTGIGAPENLPLGDINRPTRRVPIAQVKVGGQTIEEPTTATWIDWNKPVRRHAPGMPGLLGYTAMRGHRVYIDYPGRRFALSPTSGPRTARDVHQWLLKRGQAEPLERARALIVLKREDEATRLLERMAKDPAKNPHAAILLARMHRRNGDTTTAEHILESVPMRALVESGEIVSVVNALWLAGDTPRALQRAELSTVLEPDGESAWLALADASLAADQTVNARKAIAQAVFVKANPDAYLLRRAVISMLDGDRNGAMTYLRRLVRREPNNGYAAWLYARLGKGSELSALVASDLLETEGRLHPGQVPLDFLAGAWHQLDDTTQANRLMRQGLVRDCERAPNPASKNNCIAWYQSLTETEILKARELIETALVAHPERAEFLDTLSVVLEAIGEAQGARDASWRAARKNPKDVYLFTQALRLEAGLDPE
jgi:tetratricopeptide (TPR) repeat protein